MQEQTTAPFRQSPLLLVLTILTIAAAIATDALGPRTMTRLPSGLQRPGLALQFAESPEQFRTIAEQPALKPPANRAATLFRRSTIADYAFIAAYGALWLLLLLFAGGRRRAGVQYIGTTALAAAVVADSVENWGILSGLAGAAAPVAVIRASASVKWFSLAIVFLALVERFWTAPAARGWHHRALTVAVASAYAAGGLLIVVALVGPLRVLEWAPAALSVALALQLPLFWLARGEARRSAQAEAMAGDAAGAHEGGDRFEEDPLFTERLDRVRERELEYIVRRRTTGAGRVPAPEEVANTLVGLSLSGGGIRSATTNLGILQTLSRIGVLPLVDYISTVSGGGYIGGCLTSLLSVKRDPERQDRPALDSPFDYHERKNLFFSTDWRTFPFNPEPGPAVPGGVPGATVSQQPVCAPLAQDSRGKQIVAHLRTHGSFLIARRGLFKRDALRAVGHLTTGTVYHLVTALLVFFVLALVLMGIAHAIEPDLRSVLAVPPAQGQIELATVVPAGGAAAAFVVNQTPDMPWQRHFSERLQRAWSSVTADFRATDLPHALSVGAIAALAVFTWFVVATRLPAWPGRWGAGESQEDRFARIVLGVAAVIIAAGVGGACVALRQAGTGDARIGWIAEPFLVLAGARITGFLLSPLIARADFPKQWHVFDLWSREFRSLWGSFQAMTTYGMIAALLFALLPVLAYAAAEVSFWALVAPAVSLAVSRMLVAESVGKGAARWKIPRGVLRFLLGLAVLVFIGFVIVEAAAIAVYFRFDRPMADGVAQLSTAVLAPEYVIALATSGAALLLLSLAGDINRISPHYFYRDRLLETYLRTEVPDGEKRMVTFSDTTSMRLEQLHGDDPDPDGLGNTAPYLLISAAINLAGSRDLTRKDRKSGYFLFSKYYCGSRQTGYRTSDTWRKGETKLSRALTISGAAVSTAIGSNTFFAEAFVTAIFNLRLGYWMSNPRRNARDTIAFWPGYMFQEVFGRTNERTRLVNLSDGGHTGDNVGIYPLLERRCQVIIACDAEADRDLSFGSFTEAIRHAYVDLGVDIDIDLSMIRPDPATGLSKSHCAIGRIRYPECPDRPNWLIYLKNSLTGDEPAPVMNYRATCPDFPHESTADQFFDDAQFESYRALGVHIAEDTLARWAAQEDVVDALARPESYGRSASGASAAGRRRYPIPPGDYDFTEDQ